MPEPPFTYKQATELMPADQCLCDATEDGKPIGWTACPESLCERPDHDHGRAREPHAVVFRGNCGRCGARGKYHVIAIPRLATGEYLPQFGTCEACGATDELKDSDPIKPTAMDFFETLGYGMPRPEGGDG